jgi:hypothetical protein
MGDILFTRVEILYPFKTYRPQAQIELFRSVFGNRSSSACDLVDDDRFRHFILKLAQQLISIDGSRQLSKDGTEVTEKKIEAQSTTWETLHY